MTKPSFHEAVAQKLIEQMKQGTAPWQRPWLAGDVNAMIPRNPLTEKRYKGINAIQLMSEKYSDPRWMTYKQATTLEGQVRKGEKGTSIQYWAFTEERIKKDENGQTILNEHGKPTKVECRLERPRVFFATVFNAEQIDGLPLLQKQSPTWDPIERADNILQASGAVIRHEESDKAFYRLTTDSIHLPNKHQFSCVEDYYSTALHELGHWTGHSSRLDRDLLHPFGSEGYAKEELRAEIASMILGCELGVGHDPSQHAAYVSSWIQVLKNDPLEIFRAAADAEKIQNFVLSLEQVQKVVLVDEVNRDLLKDNPRTITEGIAMLNTAQYSQITDKKDDLVVSSSAIEKTWLDIPFKQKEVVKQLAGRLPNGQYAIGWDKVASRWFAHEGANLETLKPWLAHEGQPITIEKNHRVGEKTKLTIAYEEREAVKQLAGTLPDGRNAISWDKAEKCWFAHPGANLDKLTPWIFNTNNVRQEAALSPQQEFADQLKRMGAFVTDDHPIMDSHQHRIRIEGDKPAEKSGFYVGHLDGHPAGYIKNNRTGVELKWKSKGFTVSDEQKSTLLAQASEKRETRNIEHAQNQERAAQRVSEQLSQLIPMVLPTPYLKTKGIELQSGIFTDHHAQTTYIPATDETGKLWTMQYIHENGTKRFAKEGRKEGCFHAIGGLDAIAQSPVIVIAEGYATAVSVANALEMPVIAAFDAGNLEPVARALQKIHPDKPIIITGDDDRHLEATQGINPGKSKAMSAALAVNGVAVFPVFAPNEQTENPKKFTDFNDMATHSLLGVSGVNRQIKPVIDRMKWLRKPVMNESNVFQETVVKARPSNAQRCKHFG